MNKSRLQFRTAVVLLLVPGLGCSQPRDSQVESDTVPLETSEIVRLREQAEGILEVPTAKIEAMGIEIASVESRTLPAQLETTGQVDFNQDRIAHVSPRIPGRVREVRATLGDQVQAGQTLAILDSIELGKAKAEHIQALAREQLARENYQREAGLYADRISSEKEMLVAKAELRGAEATRQNSEETLRLYGLSDKEIAAVDSEESGRSLLSLEAPFEGVVVEKHITIGELLTPERNPFTIADLSQLWVWIDVFESSLQQVHLEDGVRVRVDAIPEHEFEGTVSYLSSQVDVDTRAIRARIDVANPERLLRPGMFARVKVEDPHDSGTSLSDPVLVVPDSALQREGDTSLVFVAEGQGRFRRQTVEIGRRAAGFVEITAGLTAGEKVVSRGVFYLKSEAKRDELGAGDEH